MSVLNIYRKKCEHAAELRCFRVLDSQMTFSKLESQMRCHLDGLMEVSLSKNEDGPWTILDDTFSDIYEMPIGILLSQFPGTKYIQLQCVPQTEETFHAQTSNTSVEKRTNAFEVLMENSKAVATAPLKKRSSSGVSSGSLSRKDELYNNMVDLMVSRKLFFYEPTTEGQYVTQALTNALWYITNQHTVINERSQREKGVKPIPTAFQDFEGYNEYRRKKQKSQPLEAQQLQLHAEVLMSLCIRPVMRSSPAWELAHNDIKDLAECLMSYKNYLLSQNKKVQTNQNLDHPCRPVAEWISVWTVNATCTGVKPEYKLLDKILNVSDFHKPIFFDEDTHLNSRFENQMQRARFFDRIQFSVNVDIFKYCPGGSVTTCFCLFKVPTDRSDSEKATQIASAMATIKPKLPEFHTRAMKRDFRARFSNIATVKPAVVDLLYKELALDSSAASNPEMQQRLRLIFMGETGLVADLRHLNKGRPGETYDFFFTKMAELVEEYTAADERRHNVAHLSHFLSLGDLIVQTKERCPEGTNIPSKSLVRLQFTPRNPYCHQALNFTSRINVQYKIQQRQLRISHPDDHYCNALWKYMREFAIKHAETTALFCCDDKAKVPIGEPNVHISTGVRGKKTIIPTGTTLAACDHDLHQKGNLTPSVYLHCEIPQDIKGSFYKGVVTVFMNDSVFQASGPMRHATAIVKQVKDLENKPSVILKFTDGGSDHRNNLESVKVAAICIFKELDLDFYAAARCAPGHSWTNPCERMMSILNIGLQNCTLSRSECSEAIEKVLRSCNSMDSIRKAAVKTPDLKDEWASSIEIPLQIVESRFRRLSLKGEPVKVRSSLGEEEIDLLSRHANHLFPDLDLTKLVKLHTSKVLSYTAWLEKHCRQRHYIFQIKKCQDIECCRPPKENYDFIPDPTLADDGEHYEKFETVYGTETSEKDRPTLNKPKTRINQDENPVGAEAPIQTTSNRTKKQTDGSKSKNLVPDDPKLKGDASMFTGQNARSVITCHECDKPRIIYSKVKFSRRQELQLACLLSEYQYTCGSPLTPPDNSLHGTALVRLNIECSSPVETSFYSSSLAKLDTCYYCAESGADIDKDLKRSFRTVLPVCNTCLNQGFEYPCFRPFGKRPKPRN